MDIRWAEDNIFPNVFVANLPGFKLKIALIGRVKKNESLWTASFYDSDGALADKTWSFHAPDAAAAQTYGLALLEPFLSHQIKRQQALLDTIRAAGSKN